MAAVLSTTLKQAIMSKLISSSSAYGVNDKITQIQIYTGVMPAAPENTATGTLLATIAISAVNFTGVTGGVAELTNQIAFTPTVSGTAGWARISNDVSGNALIDVNLTLVGGGGGMILSTLTLTSGTGASITAFSIKQAMQIAGKIILGETIASRIVEWIIGKSTTYCNAFYYSIGTAYVMSGTMPTVATYNNVGYLGSVTAFGGNTSTNGVIDLPYVSRSFTVSGSGGTASYLVCGSSTYPYLLKLATDTSGGIQCSTLNTTSNITDFIPIQQLSW